MIELWQIIYMRHMILSRLWFANEQIQDTRKEDYNHTFLANQIHSILSLANQITKSAMIGCQWHQMSFVREKVRTMVQPSLCSLREVTCVRSHHECPND